MHDEQEGESAGNIIVPKLSTKEIYDDQQGPSRSKPIGDQEV